MKYYQAMMEVVVVSFFVSITFSGPGKISIIIVLATFYLRYYVHRRAL